MKALVKQDRGPDGVVIKDIPEPSPGKNEIKVKVHATGICGTDIHILQDEYESKLDVVMGHEYSGIVEEVGSEVTAFKKGDRVISLTAAVTCGQCKYCYEGLLMLCPDRLSIGSGVNGGFAEYLVVPAHLAFKIPDNVSLDEAALSEPLACVVRSVIEMSSIKGGDYVLVSGPGTIGLLTMQVAKACGAKVIVTGTDIDAGRLKLAEELGANGTINISKEDIEQRVMEYTHGHGFDIAFECAGAAASADTCLKLLAKKGQYVQVGLYGKKILFDHDLALKKEIHMVNSYASERTSWERAVRLMESKQVNLTPLISAKLPIDEWRRGFHMAIHKEGFKILLTPNVRKPEGVVL